MRAAMALMIHQCAESSKQGSHSNSKTQFHDFSTIFHDKQCNFHDYIMHDLKPLLLAAS